VVLIACGIETQRPNPAAISTNPVITTSRVPAFASTGSASIAATVIRPMNGSSFSPMCSTSDPLRPPWCVVVVVEVLRHLDVLPALTDGDFNHYPEAAS
jgi:hypothetical protein